MTFQPASFLAIAEIYKTEGNEAYLKEDYSNAVYFYTEGIKVNCMDEDLKGKLYSNRAYANLRLGEATCFWLFNHWCWIFLTCFGMVRQRLVSFHWSYLLWVCFAAFAVSDFLFVCIFNVHRKLHLLTGRCQKRHGHSTIINQTNNSRWFQRFINLLVSKK